MEEGATQRQQPQGKASGQIYLQVVQAPHGMDCPQASGLQAKPKAQRLPREEEQPQGSFCCRPILGHCSLGHHHPQQSLRGSLGHDCDHAKRGMMVHASVHMEHINICSGAIGHESMFDLILRITPAGRHPQPDLPCLPYQNRGEGDHQVGSLASPGETSCHLPH